MKIFLDCKNKGIILYHLFFVFFSCVPPPLPSKPERVKEIDSFSKSKYYNSNPASYYVEGSDKLYNPNEKMPNEDFYNFIKGVNKCSIHFYKYPDYQKSIDEGNYGESDKIWLKAIQQYLFDLGFNYVPISTEDKKKLSDLPSICQAASFSYGYKTSQKYIENAWFSFADCHGHFFVFSIPAKIYIPGKNANLLSKEFVQNMKNQFYYKVGKDLSFTYKLPSIETDWNEKKLKSHYDQNGVNNIEGIYERFSMGKDATTTSKYKIGLISDKDSINAVYLGGAKNYLDWEVGEKKAILYKTATPNFYTVKWLMAAKYLNTDLYAYIDSEYGFLTFEFQGELYGEDNKSRYLKLYPSVESNDIPSFGSPSTSSTVFRSSGSGFAISTDGVIVTNHHVIEEAQVVKVQITQVGKNKMYNAKVVLSDPKNDLAILKIDDETFKGFEKIPFSIKRKVSDMGTGVYALGYPLIDTMGETIKLTDGLISSKMGYQGDITQYQLSVPVQPGNSGGPLFDKKGNLVGVINAKHTGADNATYAIKSNILANLLELLPNPPSLDNKNTLSNLSLAKQVAVIEDFVFLIKVQ